MSKRAAIFGLAVIAVLIFSLYRAKYGARESAQEITAIDAQIEAAIDTRTELLAEFSHRSRQEWIEAYARNELGMVPARAEQFVRTSELDSRVGPPGERILPAEAQEGDDAP